MSIESARKFRAAARSAFVSADRTATEMVAADVLFDGWTTGAYALGDVRRYDGQLWRCCQAHDSTGNASWCPGSVPALWAPYHTTEPRDARPYLQPTGAHDAYMAGEVCSWEGAVYRCLTDATAYDPTTLPGAWEAVE